VSYRAADGRLFEPWDHYVGDGCEPDGHRGGFHITREEAAAEVMQTLDEPNPEAVITREEVQRAIRDRKRREREISASEH
jgi:hypothetical protein